MFCRKLNPALRIVSRITHERNVEAIHRAGADFVLSYTSLGVESIMLLVSGDAAVTLSEGVRLFEVPVPPSLAGRRLSETGIGSRAGLSVVGLEMQDSLVTQLTVDTVLAPGARLVMLGSEGQRSRFGESFERS